MVALGVGETEVNGTDEELVGGGETFARTLTGKSITLYGQ